VFVVDFDDGVCHGSYDAALDQWSSAPRLTGTNWKMNTTGSCANYSMMNLHGSVLFDSKGKGSEIYGTTRKQTSQGDYPHACGHFSLHGPRFPSPPALSALLRCRSTGFVIGSHFICRSLFGPRPKRVCCTSTFYTSWPAALL
jgi:hypothetical protein